MTNRYVWLVMIATVGFGAVGFADDYLKFMKVRSKGLSAAQKFTGQIAVALAIGLMLYIVAQLYDEIECALFQELHPGPGMVLHRLRDSGDCRQLECGQSD